MKRFLIILGVVVLLMVLGNIYMILQSNGTFDSRFWNIDPSYSTFYIGNYIGGKSLMPGSYEVQIKGGAQSYGTFDIYKSEEIYNNHGDHSVNWIHEGDKGFQFTIQDGEVIEFNLVNDTEMRIKRIN